jgi:hypothetical protein
VGRGVTVAAMTWRPTLTNLGRRKPQGLGTCYGESVLAVGATAVSRVRLKVRTALETCAKAFDDPDKADRSDVHTAVYSVEDGQAHPVRTGQAGGSRWRCLASDRRCIMRPAPSEVRATSVFARGERFL